MMRTRLIVEGSLVSRDGRLSLDIRLPWYRTLPLSVIDMPVVRIDGQAVDPTCIRLEVNGKTFDTVSILSATDTWWYVLDRGLMHMEGHTLPPGEAHDVTVEVAFAPPYIPEITLFCGATRTMAAGA